MISTRCILAILILTLFVSSVISKASKTPKIESGKLQIEVKQTPISSPQLFKLSYDSSVKSELKLTQSSVISIQANVQNQLTQMNFGKQGYQPEYFTFRLRHPKYDKLTQPVKAVYDSEKQLWLCTIDLGDPRTIQPYSDLYNLEISIADPNIPAFHSTIAYIRITFRYSLTEQKIPNSNSPISYIPPSIINTSAPQQRIDPPQTFTIFIVLIMTVITLIFYYGLFVYLKVNLRLLPGDGVGFLLNIGLIVLLLVNLVFLGKFWLEWNFITTAGNFFWLTIVTALVANFGLLYIKGKK